MKTDSDSDVSQTQNLELEITIKLLRNMMCGGKEAS